MELLKNLEGLSADEQMSAVVELQKAAMKHLEEQKQASIGKSAEMVILGLKKIKSDFEAKFDSLNYDIQTKVANLKDGQQGLQGPKGEQGDRGLDGYQGKDGKSGIDGKDGLDGKDGVSVQDAKIDFDGSLVITLSDGREINVGEVVPVDVAQTIHKIQSGSGGDSQTTLNAIAALQATIATYGTMATQNANNVAITGGTINNTTIGATTPSTGVFTTLTAQTEVLKGTGQNLVVQSQAFATTWNASGLTRTNNATTAPNSTNTASSLIETATTAVHWVFTSGALNLFANTYTLSCYIKANGRTAATLALSGNASSVYSAVTFDLSGVVVSQTNVAGTGFSVVSSSITSVGSGWYRCVMTTAVPYRADYLFMVSTSNTTTFSPNSLGGANSYAGNATLGIYAWGAQLEASSTVGTYVPTTTTVLLGSPTLSFGNLAYIGMEDTGSVYIQPALTGAVQAQATTSSATGGNARGANAVDWQTLRSAASQVASGAQSVIGGGQQNTSALQYSSILGGYSNSVTSAGFYASIVGGLSNQATNQVAFIGGGGSNQATQQYATIVGGNSNLATGWYNFIGAGSANSGTANAAVTTQSGTMNATTAVTLSGSNASIKVGQYITGTSIAGQTYVAAISGTSLTLSQAASGSSTSTLSFFTPHGVVVGGGNNQATGSYSFIGGGGDAGTAANRNVASGDWSAVVGGIKNTASGQASFVGGGGITGGTVLSNTASGNAASTVGGFNNTSSGFGAFIGGGFNNISNGTYSAIMAGSYGSARGISGIHVSPASNNPFSTTGSNQSSLLLLAAQTTNATATVLTSDVTAAGTTNQIILPNNAAFAFKGTVIANVTGGGNTKAWAIEGAIKRGANAASTALVGTPTVTSAFADVGAATWAIAVTADTTNGGLAVTFTGQAATTIRCVAKLETTEVTF